MSLESVKVYVVDRKRGTLYMRYKEPVTGKGVERSTGEKTHKAAERVAAKWEAELREGRFKPKSRITWAEFRLRYENEALPALADKTALKVDATFNSFEAAISPARLADVTLERISLWCQSMRDRELSENTIKSYLAHLKAALRWAADMGMLVTVPKIKSPPRAKGGRVMKGRAIATEELERMLDKVPSVVVHPSRREKPAEEWKDHERANVEQWRRLLRGLWLSGLRLGEAMTLTWHRGSGLVVDLTGKHPMFRIPASAEKGNRDRQLPLSPEFAEMLLAVPADDREGFVFNPVGAYKERPSDWATSRIISRIGAKANVYVCETTKAGKTVNKPASAHDCRRAYGLRWAQRVMPAVLQQLMRHASVETSLRYYVGRDAEATAELLYAAVPKGDTSGDFASEARNQIDVNPCGVSGRGRN